MVSSTIHGGTIAALNGFNGGLNDFIVDYTNFRGAIAAATTCYGSTRTVGKCYGGNFNQGFGVTGLTMNTKDLNFFVQDDWRISPRLTLNLGYRYEYQMNPHQDATRVNSALPQTGNRVSDKNNHGPRIGFAYDIKGDGKTSIRGGYGIYYGRVINSTIYQALINTGTGIDVSQRQVRRHRYQCDRSVVSEPDCGGNPDHSIGELFRDQLPVAANSPVGRNLRTRDCPQHSRFSFVHGKLGTVSAELCGRESCPAHDASST